MERFQRNIQIPGFGIESQHKLEKARVLVIGAGGLGSPVLYYLAAAGIGTIGIVDYDTVDITNLQRQVIHTTNDIGRNKAVSASEKLKALYPDIAINVYPEKFTGTNAAQLVNSYDFTIDCCDNFAAKFLINDTCVKQGKAYSHGAVSEMRGEVMTYIPGTANYRNLYETQPQDSEMKKGILGGVAGIIGSIQAVEAIKYITGLGELITNRILIFDALTMSFSTLSLQKG